MNRLKHNVNGLTDFKVLMLPSLTGIDSTVTCRQSSCSVLNFKFHLNDGILFLLIGVQ